MIPDIKIRDYAYPLTDDRIAKYPLPQRDSSKLLIYKDGNVSEKVFRDIPGELESDSLMVFNDTKVVPARLHFRRSTGARIEVFCLKPIDPVDYNLAFSAKRSCTWRCVIGNSKRWKDDILECEHADDAELASLDLKAQLLEREDQSGLVKFTWNGEVPFSTVLELCGNVPIPPYLNRETEAIDLDRYQTMYAKIRGSVAAPTAGLHFTDQVLENIRTKGIDLENVCLHVGAGTFLPVKSESVLDHPMHREPFAVSRELLVKLRDKGEKHLTAVGTTSVRTLESLYYVGASIIENGHPSDVEQWCPYDREYSYTTEQALDAIIEYLDNQGLSQIKVETRIIIVPGFRFRLVDRLVTNFHQSESTLILLVAAFVKGDWRIIYDYALSHEFRFLSYGDSSLIFRRNDKQI